MRNIFWPLALAVPLVAHDLYLMPKPFRLQPGQSATIAFHNGDDFPIPDRPPKLENVLDALVLTAQGRTPLANLRVEGKILLAEATLKEPGSAYAIARTRPNFIEIQPLKFEEYLKHEGLTSVLAWRTKHAESAKPGRERYSKYVKSLLHAGQPSDFYRQPVGFPIEIVPDQNPAAVHPGGQLPIRVLLHGKPAADLQIEVAWLNAEGKFGRAVAGRTAKDGTLKISITTAGTWKLHTVSMQRCTEPAVADWESLWSSLTFAIQ
jgi:hypothetical protein